MKSLRFATPEMETERLLSNNRNQTEVLTPKQKRLRDRKRVGAAVAFAAVIIMAFEGTMLRLLQLRRVPTETFLFFSCLGKGLVQLTFANCFLLNQMQQQVDGAVVHSLPRTRRGWICYATSWCAGFCTSALLQLSGCLTTAVENFSIFYTYPLFGSALAVVVLNDELPYATCVTFALVMACLVPIIVHAAFVVPQSTTNHTWSSADPRHESSLLGDVLALVAAVAFGAHLVGTRFMAQNEPAVLMAMALGGGMITGALVQLPFVIANHGSLHALLLPGVDSQVWPVIALYSLLGGGYYAALTFAVQLTSVQHVSAIAMFDVVLGPFVTNTRSTSATRSAMTASTTPSN